jgi:hypothetical protein
MSIETGGPVTAYFHDVGETVYLRDGRKIYWGLISFRDSHSRDEEVKRFIAERMSFAGSHEVLNELDLEYLNEIEEWSARWMGLQGWGI